MADQKHAGSNQAALPERAGRFGDDKHPNIGKDTQFTPGQSGNPVGEPKGRKSLSTQIQQMMDDPKFIERLSQGAKRSAA